MDEQTVQEILIDAQQRGLEVAVDLYAGSVDRQAFLIEQLADARADANVAWGCAAFFALAVLVLLWTRRVWARPR